MAKLKQQFETIHKECTVISQQTHKMAKGNLEIQNIQASNTKLDDLANDINKIASLLNGYISEISRVLSHLSIGDLTVDVSKDLKFSGDFIPIKTALSKLTVSLNHAFKNIDEVMYGINSICEQTTEQANTVAQNAENQAEKINVLSSVIKDISVKTEDNAKRAVEVSKCIDTALEDTQQGRNYMDQMLKAMDEVTVSSKNISHIVEMISAISNQTKLLSLNASIEAARAGESGRGFAVVANEIGNLALQTTEAVMQTTDLVNESISKVDESEKMVKLTASSFENISSAIAQASTESEGIKDATSEQTASIQNVVSVIESLSSIIESNAAFAEESASSNLDLQEKTLILKDLLDEFIIDKSKNKILAKKDVDEKAFDFIHFIEEPLKTIDDSKLDDLITKTISEHDYVECVYIINEEGIQVSHTIMSPHADIKDKESFQPALPGHDHSTKKYFVQGLNQNGDTYISYEYISSATGSLCSTYSKAYHTLNGNTYVLCVDMKYM